MKQIVCEMWIGKTFQIGKQRADQGCTAMPSRPVKTGRQAEPTLSRFKNQINTRVGEYPTIQVLI